MLNKGDKAPDFELGDENGELVRLSDLLSDGPVLVYFYPKDFTSVCTRQACRVRDNYERIEEAGLQVIGINSEKSEKHARFRKHHELPFRLLVDPERLVARAWKALGPFGLYTARVSYLVGTDRVIKDAVRADLRLGPHERLIEQALSRERSD
ncbi:MAG: peroxiredoxin [Planctomycetota bacterium]